MQTNINREQSTKDFENYQLLHWRYSTMDNKEEEDEVKICFLNFDTTA